MFKVPNLKLLAPDILFYILLLTFFLQTRYAFSARHQIVDYLILFVYLSDTLIVLLLIKSLKSLKSLRNGKLSFQFFSFFVFLFFTAISNLSATNPLSAWYCWFKILEFGAFAFWLAWFLGSQQNSHDREKIVTLFFFLNLGLLLECLIAIAEFFWQRSLGLQILGEWRFSVATPGIAKVILFGKEFLRPYATFPHPNVLGGILAIMASVSLHLGISGAWEKKGKGGERNKRVLLFTFYFLLFTFVLFLTFSRSAWLAYAVLMAIVLGSWGWKVRGFREFGGLRKWIVPVFLFALYCSLFATPFVYQRVKSLQTTDVLSVERRVELTRAAIAMFRDHPLFGVGLGNFIPNLEKYLVVSGQGRFLQPVHNIPLLILAETGVAGFSALFLFIAVLLYEFLHRLEFRILDFKFVSNFEFRISDFTIILMWTGIFIISFFDHYFWTLQAGQLFFWLTVGLTLGLTRDL